MHVSMRVCVCMHVCLLVGIHFIAGLQLIQYPTSLSPYVPSVNMGVLLLLLVRVCAVCTCLPSARVLLF